MALVPFFGGKLLLVVSASLISSQTITDDPEAEDSGTLTTCEKSWVPVHELVRDIPADVTVARDHEGMLKCTPSVSGASVQWLKDEALLNGSMPLAHLYVVSPGILWIRRMNSNLAGRYTCLVTTKDRRTLASAQVTMTGEQLHGKCDISYFFLQSSGDRELSYGETAVLRCMAHGRPRDVEISWLRNGLPFRAGLNLRSMLSVLFINYAKPNDSAVYTCVATNLRNNCTIQESALLRVLPKVNIKEICGTPIVAQPNMYRPRIERGRIVGGMDIVKGAHPWQVMFWTETRRAFCGGSLVNDQWVLTASHCFDWREMRIEEVEVRLGKYDQGIVEPQQFVTRIANVHFHPNFNVSTFDNDIALVKLADRVAFTDYIRPVCLGESVAIEREYFSSGDVQLGTVTGWGQLTERVSTLPRLLQEIRLPIVDHGTCKASTRHLVTNNMFCAGYKEEMVGDACMGDSGGPFVVQRNKRWYLIGIVSWGIGCARKDQYGYYAKVSKYHRWIKESILSS